MNVDVSNSVLNSHACFTALATLQHVENGEYMHINNMKTRSCTPCTNVKIGIENCCTEFRAVGFSVFLFFVCSGNYRILGIRSQFLCFKNFVGLISSICAVL